MIARTDLIQTRSEQAIIAAHDRTDTVERKRYLVNLAELVGFVSSPILTLELHTSLNGPRRRDVVLVGGDAFMLSFDLFRNEHFVAAKCAFK